MLDDFSILHLGKFYPPHMGGMETHLRELAIRQARHASVKVIVSNHSARYQQAMIDGVYVTRVPCLGTIASMPICPSLAGIIKQSPTDLVHIHVPNPGAALAFLLSIHKGKVIVTHHADTLGRKVLRRFSDPFVHKVMNRAEAIIVTSKSYMRSSEELQNWTHKCHVIPLGIDLTPFQGTSSQASKLVRQKYGQRLVLSVGRLVPYKGFEYLIRSMKNVNGTLLLVGTGPLHDQLQACIRECGVQNKVHMLGHVHEIAPYYSAADIFVLPSITRAEAFGVVQIEAMASGLPIINTDIASGVPDVSLNGQTGITVPPRSEEALSEAMNRLLDNAELRKRFGDAARERATAEFSIETMVDKTIDLYRSVLNKP